MAETPEKIIKNDFISELNLPMVVAFYMVTPFTIE